MTFHEIFLLEKLIGKSLGPQNKRFKIRESPGKALKLKNKIPIYWLLLRRNGKLVLRKLNS